MTTKEELIKKHRLENPCYNEIVKDFIELGRKEAIAEVEKILNIRIGELNRLIDFTETEVSRNQFYARINEIKIIKEWLKEKAK